MSWARILRFAKQRQVPVVITDESGEDPMILLSLDALEQALDGGVGPDLPPPTPAPRSTTPSFVPEQFEMPVYKEAPPVVEEEPVPEPESIEIVLDPEPELAPEPESEPEPVPESTPVLEPIPDLQQESVSVIKTEPTPIPLVINDFETPEPPKSVPVGEDRHAEVEIMTPPMSEPAHVDETPAAEIKTEEVKSGLADTVKLADPTNKPKDISLEERFFLDF